MDGEQGLVAGAPVPSLVRWGFSADADLLYRALVTLGPRSGKWLARDLGLTLRRVDSAVEELLSAGAVDGPAGGQGAALRARPVADVLAALRVKRRALLADQRTKGSAERARHHHALVGGAALPHGPPPNGLRATHLVGRGATRER